jgi:hypothetical protein
MSRSNSKVGFARVKPSETLEYTLTSLLWRPVEDCDRYARIESNEMVAVTTSTSFRENWEPWASTSGGIVSSCPKNVIQRGTRMSVRPWAYFRRSIRS